jgi:hypothetical protein
MSARATVFRLPCELPLQSCEVEVHSLVHEPIGLEVEHANHAKIHLLAGRFQSGPLCSVGSCRAGFDDDGLFRMVDGRGLAIPCPSTGPDKAPGCGGRAPGGGGGIRAGAPASRRSETRTSGGAQAMTTTRPHALRRGRARAWQHPCLPHRRDCSPPPVHANDVRLSCARLPAHGRDGMCQREPLVRLHAVTLGLPTRCRLPS